MGTKIRASVVTTVQDALPDVSKMIWKDDYVEFILEQERSKRFHLFCRLVLRNHNPPHPDQYYRVFFGFRDRSLRYCESTSMICCDCCREGELWYHELHPDNIRRHLQSLFADEIQKVTWKMNMDVIKSLTPYIFARLAETTNKAEFTKWFVDILKNHKINKSTIALLTVLARKHGFKKNAVRTLRDNFQAHALIVR